jgi:hypothetical protein
MPQLQVTEGPDQGHQFPGAFVPGHAARRW